MKRLPLLVATLLTLAGSAQANGLDDMKTALAALQGQSALRGNYDIRQTTTDLDKGTPAQTVAATVQVEEDGGALALRWDRALLKRAADEDKRPKSGDHLSSLIAGTTATRLADVVNYAPKMLDTLAHSQFVSEKADTYQGKPARLLQLTYTPPMEENSKVSIKENAHVAQVWIGADGVPLAVNMTHKLRGSFMMFISFEQSSRDELVFNVVNNRLVLARRDEQGTRKGAGSDATYHNVYVFTPRV